MYRSKCWKTNMMKNIMIELHEYFDLWFQYLYVYEIDLLHVPIPWCVILMINMILIMMFCRAYLLMILLSHEWCDSSWKFGDMRVQI